MLKKHNLNCDGGATVVRAPSVNEETRMVKTNASTVHEEFCFRRCLLLNYSYHSYISIMSPFLGFLYSIFLYLQQE